MKQTEKRDILQFYSGADIEHTETLRYIDSVDVPDFGITHIFEGARA